MSLRRYKNLSANFNYELQFAKGTGSASGNNFDIAWQQGSKGHFPKFQMPLSFEQRHTGTLNLDYRLGEDAPVYLRYAGVNLIYQFTSGNPYTLMKVLGDMPHDGRYDNEGISQTPVSDVNGETTPWTSRLDLKIDKGFDILNTRLTAYIWVRNLLNTRNVRDVWISTGLPNDTGYRSTPAGEQAWESWTEQERRLFLMREWDPYNYGTPRQIRLGLQLEI